MVDYRLFAYAVDSTLLAAARKPADRPAVAASHNRGLARIQEWCNNWCMMLHPDKTKDLVISRSRNMSPPHGDLVLFWVSVRASPDLGIHGVKFDSKLTIEDDVRGFVSRVSQRIGILRLVKRGPMVRLVKYLFTYCDSTAQYVELRVYSPWGWGRDQSIGSSASDAIVRSWLWSTVTRSSILGYFSSLLQVVDNWPHILW